MKTLILILSLGVISCTMDENQDKYDNGDIVCHINNDKKLIVIRKLNGYRYYVADIESRTKFKLYKDQIKEC